MLIGNYSVLNKNPGRSIAGSTVADTRPNFGQTNAARNRFFGRFDPKQGSPSGYLPPGAWVMPQTAGGMSSFKSSTGVSTPFGTLTSTGALAGASAGASTPTATLSGVNAITGSSAGTSTPYGLLTAAAGDQVTLTNIAAAIWGAPAASFVDPATMGGKLAIVRAILQNKTITDPSNGQMTVYADDGVTPLFIAQVFENVAGTQAYRGQGADRRDALA